MAVQIRPEGRSFRGGWISDLTKADSVDAFRYPRGWWSSLDEDGAVETAPGHTLVHAHPKKISSLYKSDSDDGGIVLRMGQFENELLQLLPSGVPTNALKQNVDPDSRLVYTTMRETLPSGLPGKEYVFCFNGIDDPFKIELEINPLAPINVVTCSAADPGTALTAAGANFQGAAVEPFWTINNLTDGSSAYITSVTGQDTLLHEQLTGGTTNTWQVGDAINVAKVSKMGLDRPDASQVTIALDELGQNNVRGFVRYFISQVEGTNESPLSEESARVNAVAIDAGDVPSAEDGVRVLLTFDDALYYGNTYRLYRTYKDGAEPYFIGTVTVGADPPGATFIDDLHDADLSDPPFAFGDPPPVEATSCLTYFNRLYLLVGNLLYWSDVGQPESYYTAADGNFLSVGQSDGDVGTALARARNGILFGKKAHVYKVWGRTPREFEVEELMPSDQTTRAVGIPSPSAFTYTENGIYFFFEKRFYFFNPASDSINRVSKLVEEDIEILIGDTIEYTENGLWDIVVGRDPQVGRIWVTAQNATFFFDEGQRRFVGAHEHGYRCYLTEGYGNDSRFLLGGYRTDIANLPATNEESMYKAEYGKAFEGRDLLFVPLPFIGTGPMVRRFGWVDIYMGDPSLAVSAQSQGPVNQGQAGNAFTADFLVGIDGDEILDLKGELVKAAGTKRRTIYRLYLNAIGHDLEVVFIYSHVENAGNKMLLYHMEANYQAMRGRSGTLLQAI